MQAPATWEAITQTSVIGGLITNYSATPSVNVGGGVIYDDVRDLGAAFQIAIWSQVYTGVTYTVNAALLHEVGATDANFHTLVNMITAAALPADWRKLTSPFPNTAFPNNNQDLGVVLPNPSVGVPGPLAGAGLPGLFAACAGLLLLARRRRQKLA